MERALVAVDPSTTNADMLREAAELANGVDASLVVFSLMTDENYQEDADMLSAVEDVEGTSYDKNPDRIARLTAEQYAKDHLSDLEITYEARGTVADEDDRANAILKAAKREDCDYIFLAGKRRSPTGKAIFGDTAQAVILSFDGRVVVTTE